MSQTASTENDDPLKKHLSPIVEELHTAESAIKSAEKIDEKISLVAINQARNGFNHICVGLKLYWDGYIDQAEEEFQKSKGHCRRAYYDACDAELTYCMSQINSFIRQCHENGLQMHEIIDDYSSKATLLTKVKRFLAEQSKIKDKWLRYEEIAQFRDTINLEIYDKLEGYYEVANEKANILDKKQFEINEQKRQLEAQQVQIDKSNKLMIIAILVAIVIPILMAIYQTDLQSYFNSNDNENIVSEQD